MLMKNRFFMFYFISMGPDSVGSWEGERFVIDRLSSEQREGAERGEDR